jgi:hypothetical protein
LFVVVYLLVFLSIILVLLFQAVLLTFICSVVVCLPQHIVLVVVVSCSDALHLLLFHDMCIMCALLLPIHT